jgi:hypothetical protein
MSMRLCSSIEYLTDMPVGSLLELLEDIIEVDEERKRLIDGKKNKL